MNVLVIGSGAREHAIARALSLSPQKPQIFCCGTSKNPGIMKLTTDYRVLDITKPEGVLEACKAWRIELAIIGPEAPLAEGVSDALITQMILVVGPTRALAQIETSKIFARELMKKYGISGSPQYKLFNTDNDLVQFLDVLGRDGYVIKANGLMGGKGVKVAGEHLLSMNETLDFCEKILSSGQDILVEEKLIGQEFSLMCFTDGDTVVPMPVVQDHKRAYDGDLGSNTGGMGSFSSPNHGMPFLTEEEILKAQSINEQVIDALRRETCQLYRGILYGSFIATAKGVYVIEFNARFGDPESLNVLPLLNSDFLALCLAIAQGNLSTDNVSFAAQATVCKYVVPDGYPDDPVKGYPVDFSEVQDPWHLYFGAVEEKEGVYLETGSRTAAYVGIAPSIEQAEAIAEAEVSRITGPLFHREDIGTSAYIEKKINQMENLKRGSYE